MLTTGSPTIPTGKCSRRAQDIPDMLRGLHSVVRSLPYVKTTYIRHVRQIKRSSADPPAMKQRRAPTILTQYEDRSSTCTKPLHTLPVPLAHPLCDLRSVAHPLRISVFVASHTPATTVTTAADAAAPFQISLVTAARRTSLTESVALWNETAARRSTDHY